MTSHFTPMSLFCFLQTWEVGPVRLPTKLCGPNCCDAGVRPIKNDCSGASCLLSDLTLKVPPNYLYWCTRALCIPGLTCS